MDNDNIPAIRAFKARLGFANDTLSFNTFEGEVGGGTFKLGGTIRLPKLNEPVFDLRMQSNEVLVMRNDSITVRADARPAARRSARRGGGRAARSSSPTAAFSRRSTSCRSPCPAGREPAPSTARTFDTGVSFPQPPLRDWKFDLAIKTRPNDDFLDPRQPRQRRRRARPAPRRHRPRAVSRRLDPHRGIPGLAALQHAQCHARLHLLHRETPRSSRRSIFRRNRRRATTASAPSSSAGERSRRFNSAANRRCHIRTSSRCSPRA